MSGPLSILNVLSHNPKVVNLKILFANNMDIQIVDHNIFNKYIIYKLNQYAAANVKDQTV